MIKELEKNVFKKKRRKIVCHSLNYYEKLDENLQMIPLSFKPAFWNMYFYKDLMKKILIKLLGLDDSYYDEDLYYGEDIMLCMYPSYLKKTSIIISLKDDVRKVCFKDLFNIHDSLVWNFVKYNSSQDEVNSLYEIIINCQDESYYDKDIVFRDDKNNINMEGFGIFVRNVIYYKKKFLNGELLDEKELLLLIFSASSFKELYEVLICIFDKYDTDKFMRFAVETSHNSKIKRLYMEYRGVRG